MGTISGPEPKGWPSWGVDLNPSSNTMTPEHWDWLKDHGCSFVIGKASHAGQYVGGFTGQVLNAEKRGMKIGGYLLLRPANERPIPEQVYSYLLEMKTLTGRPYCYAVDIEGDWGREDKPGMAALEACTLILVATGRRPLIYTYPAFYRSWLARNVGLRAFPLWGAWYPKLRGGERSIAEVEQQFGRSVQVWQYGGGPVDGQPSSPKISKNVTKR